MTGKRAKAKKSPLRKRLRRARRHAGFALGRSAVRWIGKLEIARAQKLGETVGAFAYRVRTTDRRRALRHLHDALGLDARASARTAKRMFGHFGRVAAEMAVLRRLGAEAVDTLVEPDSSVSIIDDALAAGRGAIIITPHLGHFELIAAWFALRGYKGKVVGARVAFDPYNAFLDEGRRNLGFETIFTDESPREILKVLRANGLVGMLPDQDIDKMEGVFVPFFGRPAYTPKGPVVLAQAARAALVPVFIPWVEEKRRYRLVVRPPVELVATDDRDRDVVENTHRWSRVFETFIAKHADQWPWIHRRWRTTPERLERRRKKRERHLDAQRTSLGSTGKPVKQNSGAESVRGSRQRGDGHVERTSAGE